MSEKETQEKEEKENVKKEETSIDEKDFDELEKNEELDNLFRNLINADEISEENSAENTEIDSNELIKEITEEMKEVQKSEKLPLKQRIILKTHKYKRKLPFIGNSPSFIAYMIKPRGSERVRVFKSVNNQFFEYDDTEYFIHRNKLVSMKYENEPVLIYRKGVTEPVDPTASNKEITFSNEVTTAVEGTVIDQFNSAELNFEYLEKRLNLNFIMNAVSIILAVLIIIALIQNNLFLGG